MIPNTQEKGVYRATRKDGSVYFRSSLTYEGKHISLGSFETAAKANACYEEGILLLQSDLTIDDYKDGSSLPFKKWVSLVNFRDHKIYFKTPIYLKNKYFHYYLSPTEILKFSQDDLFYYASHSIQRRGGHLFVSDYGMQVTLLGRYGIKNFAVLDRDYRFRNGDILDYRYENLEIMNHYMGVEHTTHRGKECFKAKIHVNGDFIVGFYQSEKEAAIAYNKAIDVLKKKGCPIEYTFNYIEDFSPQVYAELYTKCKISPKLYSLSDFPPPQ